MPDEPPFDPEYDTGPTQRTPPQAISAEMAVLGALIQAPHLAEELTLELKSDDFWKPQHQTIWDTCHHLIDTGTPLDLITLEAQLSKVKELVRVGGGPYLHTLVESCLMPAHAGYYAVQIRNAARAREIHNVGSGLVQIAANADLDDLEPAFTAVYERMDGAYARFGPTTRTKLTVPNVQEFLIDTGQDTYEWIIPGLLERHDRVILTGGEGSGKSTLGRQIAVQATAGIHPFTGQPMDPIRVLILDFENTEAQLKRELAKLYGKASRHLEVDRLRIQSRIAGVNLLNPDDRAWVDQVVTDANPDLIITGPAYKMTDGDTDKEKESKPVALFLDQIRSTHNTAIWLEAHVGNEQAGTKKRPERPFGWSGWRRWPEFGIYLSKEGDLNHWRGDRDQRDWPAGLTREGPWPWQPAQTADDERFETIKECVIAAGQILSNREIGRQTNIADTTVRRVIDKYSQQWQGVRYLIQEVDEQ